MSDKKVLNEKEINEEILDKVDGGIAMNDLLMSKDRKSMNVETLPTGGRTWRVSWMPLSTRFSITAEFRVG